MKKICFIASSGGHFEQLMMLKPLMEQNESFIVTEKTEYGIKSNENVFFLQQINRNESKFLIYFVINIYRSAKIFLKKKPDIVVSTGVLATIPMCIIAKLFRKKVIYIESYAKINTPTITGKLMYKIADEFYVQWKEMLEIYPKSIYVGGVY